MKFSTNSRLFKAKLIDSRPLKLAPYLSMEDLFLFLRGFQFLLQLPIRASSLLHLLLVLPLSLLSSYTRAYSYTRISLSASCHIHTYLHVYTYRPLSLLLSYSYLLQSAVNSKLLADPLSLLSNTYLHLYTAISNETAVQCWLSPHQLY